MKLVQNGTGQLCKLPHVPQLSQVPEAAVEVPASPLHSHGRHLGHCPRPLPQELEVSLPYVAREHLCRMTHKGSRFCYMVLTLCTRKFTFSSYM
jgi:hypothetical protein